MRLQYHLKNNISKLFIAHQNDGDFGDGNLMNGIKKICEHFHFLIDGSNTQNAKAFFKIFEQIEAQHISDYEVRKRETRAGIEEMTDGENISLEDIEKYYNAFMDICEILLKNKVHFQGLMLSIPENKKDDYISVLASIVKEQVSTIKALIDEIENNFLNKIMEQERKKSTMFFDTNGKKVKDPIALKKFKENKERPLLSARY